MSHPNTETKPSNIWQKLQKETSVAFKQACGEPENVCEETVAAGITKLSPIMKVITYRILQMVIKWGCFCSQGKAQLCSRDERYTSRAHSKQTLTVLSVFMTGDTENLRL
jgi:hypothetical protein